MTTDDQGKKDESSQTPEERIEEIKNEAKEDASGYYAQEDSKDNVSEAAEFNKAVEPVKAEQEEMNMLKAVAFLGFGMAALAIIFILFFSDKKCTKKGDLNNSVDQCQLGKCSTTPVFLII